jgi:hypothetical protein
MLTLTQLYAALEENHRLFMQAAQDGNMNRMLELNAHKHHIKDEIISLQAKICQQLMQTNEELRAKVG